MNAAYVARLQIKPELNRDMVLDALRELEALTQAEPECFLFRLFETEVEDELVILEVFKSPEALQYHYDTPYTKAYFEKGYTDIQSFQKLTALQSLDCVFEQQLLKAG